MEDSGSDCAKSLLQGFKNVGRFNTDTQRQSDDIIHIHMQGQVAEASSRWKLMQCWLSGKKPVRLNNPFPLHVSCSLWD